MLEKAGAVKRRDRKDETLDGFSEAPRTDATYVYGPYLLSSITCIYSRIIIHQISSLTSDVFFSGEGIRLVVLFGP